MRKHGINDILITPYFDSSIMKADLVATWAYRPKLNNLWGMVKATQKMRGGQYLVMERAYIDNRFKWVSLGYDGLNGNADFCNSDIKDPTRWDKHFASQIQAWKTSGKKVLVSGQCYHDASIAHTNIEKWYYNTIKTLNEMNISVIFRQHPMNKKPWKDLSLKYEIDRSPSFEESLGQDIRCVVTFNSNAGVLATLAGIPAISFDKGSMVYNITKHSLDDLDYKPDRTEWASKIAYTQWLPEELESGEAWEHLKKKFL